MYKLCFIGHYMIKNQTFLDETEIDLLVGAHFSSWVKSIINKNKKTKEYLIDKLINRYRRINIIEKRSSLPFFFHPTVINKRRLVLYVDFEKYV